ncbi:sigma factor [Microbacterium elymi]|uniref:sigma factor n=1 Tax=Microbacterium elymi TaxID=2909587 RepID=UPI00338E6995
MFVVMMRVAARAIERSAMVDADAAISRTYREEWSMIVAGLVRRYGDLDIAEETAAEAFATAVERWPVDGVPPNPGAWITTTAHRKAVDRLAPRGQARRQTEGGASHGGRLACRAGRRR